MGTFFSHCFSLSETNEINYEFQIKKNSFAFRLRIIKETINRLNSIVGESLKLSAESGTGEVLIVCKSQRIQSFCKSMSNECTSRACKLFLLIFDCKLIIYLHETQLH